jgi:hypothetical protein
MAGILKQKAAVFTLTRNIATLQLKKTAVLTFKRKAAAFTLQRTPAAFALKRIHCFYNYNM